MSATTTTHKQRAGERLWFLHNLSRILVDGEEGEGRFSLVDMTGAPGDMPPLHVHHEEDETFYLIDGELELHIAGREPVRVLPGQAGFAPRGVPHAYRVTSPDATHWLVACTGRSFAGLVRDVSVPARTPTLPVDPQINPEEIARISAHHGIEILGPPGTLP
ncbi:MAG TPA: cupin domain-containing protein [Solirubrobacteraceae bacterium]|nr:cupin domain-containing protein [Solirubrobacteraceae bacterium]